MKSWFETIHYTPGDSAGQVESRVRDLVEYLALDYFSFAMVVPPRDNAVGREPAILTNYPDEWQDRYVENRYIAVDPVIRLAREATKPFFWGHGRFLRGFRKQQRLIFG